MRTILFTLAICSLLISCSQEVAAPENLIEEDTYIDLLVELQLVKSHEEMFYARKSVTDSLMQQVFDKYGVTQEQFEQSHQYYQQQIEQQQTRVDEAVERLRKDLLKTTRKDSANQPVPSN